MGKLYPVEQRHTEAAQRYFGYPLSPADAAHVIDVATHFARFEAEHLTRIEATPAVDREGVEEAIARMKAAISFEIGMADPGTDTSDWIAEVRITDLQAILALHPAKQSDGLAERVKEACARVASDHITDDSNVGDCNHACREIASAIRSLDITRMGDSD